MTLGLVTSVPLCTGASADTIHQPGSVGHECEAAHHQIDARLRDDPAEEEFGMRLPSPSVWPGLALNTRIQRRIIGASHRAR